MLSDEAEHALLAYPWPGNIRELENVVHRAVLVATGDEIAPGDLALPTLPEGAAAATAVTAVTAPVIEVAAPEPGSDEALRAVLDRLLEEGRSGLLDWLTDQAVRRAYLHGDGSQVQAARLLGVSRNIFRTLMKRGGLLSGEGRVGRVVEDAHRELLST